MIICDLACNSVFSNYLFCAQASKKTFGLVCSGKGERSFTPLLLLLIAALVRGCHCRRQSFDLVIFVTAVPTHLAPWKPEE